MALDVVISRGSADLAVRVVIAGLPIQFVSDPRMQKTTSDGRGRVYCLPPGGDGIVLEEKVNIQEAELDVGGVSLRLFETRDQQVSQALHHNPTITRWLASDAEAVDSTLTLLGASGISANDYLHIGTETIKVGGVSGADLTGCNRGQWDTIALKHWTNDAESLPPAMVTDRPLRIRGRRALIFLYDDGDDLTGNGTLKWTGEVASEPSISDAGNSFTLQLGSAAERLDQPIGGNLADPFTLRGIYYSWAHPLHLRIQENGVDYIEMFFGFFESQEEFLGATDGSDAGTFNEFLANFKTTHSLDATIRAVADPEDPARWTFEVVFGASALALVVDCQNYVDGRTLGALWLRDGSVVSTLSSGLIAYVRWQNAFGLGAYERALPAARMVPRGVIGVPPSFPNDATQVSTWPARRLYVGTEATADIDTVSIEWGDGRGGSYPVDTTAVSTADDHILLERIPPVFTEAGASEPFYAVYTASAMPTIRAIRSFAEGDLDDFRDKLVSEAVDYASIGLAPLLTTAHLDDWEPVVDEVATRLWQKSRAWLLSQPQNLLELLVAEWRLLGVYPYVTSDGKIGLKKLEMPNAATAADHTITEEIPDGDWSTLSTGGQTTNVAKLERGYDAVQDEYTLTPREVQDFTAIGLDMKRREVVIEPKSYAIAGDRMITALELAEVVLPTLMLFGYPFDIVQVNVSYKHFDVLLGDVVSFSAAHLPRRATGTRGKSNVAALCIGRRWELGKNFGQLTLLLSGLNLAGYSPTARVSSQVDNGGDEWDITIDNSKYAPSGATVASFFTVGDKVKVVEYDSESPATVDGTVQGISSNVLTVQFDATWTPGADTWELIFQGYDAVVAAQQVYAFQADSGAVLGSAADNPRVFAP